MAFPRIDHSRLDKLWRDLVEIESGSHDGEGIRRVGDTMAAALRRAGCVISEADVAASGAATIVATRTGVGRALMLLGHLDTVWPKGTLRQMPLHADGNRLYGPGVADMKGGLAVMAEALMATVDTTTRRPVVAVLTPDEELGTPVGRMAIDANIEGIAGALVFESARPGGLLINQRRGSAIFEIEVAGRTAHVAHEPEVGINAVDELVNQLQRLRELRDPEIGTSVMAGVISGGTARQVVPERAHALVDVRARSSSELDRIIRAIRAAPDHTRVAGASVKVSGGMTRPPMVQSTDTWLHDALSTAGDRVGVTIEYTAAGGGSDANLTAARGIPTVDGLGPEGFRICSRDEAADIESATSRAQLVAQLLLDA